jgi:hypothetical protein
MRGLLAMLIALLLAPAAAQAQEIGAMVGSWHSAPSACDQWTRGRGCESWNPGLFWRSSDGWIGGAYRNSVGRPTAFAGRVWTLAERGPIAGEVAAMAATGYPAAPVVPIASPLLAVRASDRATVRLGWIPRVGRWNPTHVVYLSVGWRIGD